MATVTIGDATYDSLGDVWDAWVGNSVAEMLRDEPDPETAVGDYLDSLRASAQGRAGLADLGGDDPAATVADLRAALVAYIERVA